LSITHILTAWARKCWLEKWFRIEWYQPLEHVSGEQPLALPVLRWTGLQLERLGEVFHGRMASERETLQGGAPQLATVVLCTIDYIIYISVSRNYDDGNMS